MSDSLGRAVASMRARVRRRHVARASLLGLAIPSLLGACSALVDLPGRYYSAPDAQAVTAPIGPIAVDAKSEADVTMSESAPQDSPTLDVADGTPQVPDGPDEVLPSEANADVEGSDADAPTNPEATTDDAQAPLSPRLRLWLTADVGLTCASQRVTRWADQSGHGDDAVVSQQQLGPACSIGHAAAGVDLPYFGDLPDAGMGGSIDGTLDVDLSFLANSDYTLFVVERRWADPPAGVAGRYESLIGTTLPPQAGAGCWNTSTPDQMVSFGYVFNGGTLDFSLDHHCDQIDVPLAWTPASPRAPLQIDTALFDAFHGGEVFQNGTAIASNATQKAASYAGGGGIGRVATESTDAGQLDGRFQGDIAEVLAYDKALDDAERGAVTAYLQRHWQLPRSELVWLNTSTGDLSTWLLAGATVTATQTLSTRAPPGASFVDTSSTSLLWNETGTLVPWSIDANGSVFAEPGLTWTCNASSGCAAAQRPVGRVTLKAAGCDSGATCPSQAGLLWYDSASGVFTIWLIADDGHTVTGTQSLSRTCCATPSWTPVLTADFDGDGNTDLLTYNSAPGPGNGLLSIWFLQDASGTVKGTSDLSWTCGTGDGCENTWKIIAAGDVNGDGHVDLLWQNAGTGEISTWLLDGASSSTIGTAINYVIGKQSLSRTCGPGCADNWKALGYLSLP